MGIIADIDVWNVTANAPERFIEAKAQKIIGKRTTPIFHLSSAEWRSYQNAKAKGVTYEIWLFQYCDAKHLRNASQRVTLIIFDEVSKDWLNPEGYLIAPPSTAGKRRKLRKMGKP
jgi:hypothetical protein